MNLTVGLDNKKIEVVLPTALDVGVMLSGGADSAILLYMLILEKHQTKSKHTIRPFTVARSDGAWNYVAPIVDWIKIKTQTDICDPIKVGNPKVHHSKQGRSGADEAFSKYGIQHIFYGSQAHPPVPMPGDYPNRPTAIHLPNTTCPFALVDKRHTLHLYDKLDVWDLIKLTHSCTHKTKGRCGECYNCTERAWALADLGFSDPGEK
jgi:hypothetical protein